MPFDPAPRTQPENERSQKENGRFAHFADAMLRGCAVTKPLTDGGCFADGGTRACALGALWLGVKGVPTDYDPEVFREFRPLLNAYCERYGSNLFYENDDGLFTREQIAERIRAL